MPQRFAPTLALALAAAVAAHAQDAKDTPLKEKKDEAPKANIVKAPDGWKYVKAKDMSHAFLVPRSATSERSSEGNFRGGGFTGKTATYVATLKDGRTFIVVQTNLGGPATKDMKIKDVYDLMYDADKSEKGTKISEPKEIAVGKRKGQEYFVTDKDSVRRVVTVVVRGRVIQLCVEADSKDKLTEKDCDTFLTSLILYAPPKKDAPKKDGEKPAEKKETPKDQ